MYAVVCRVSVRSFHRRVLHGNAPRAISVLRGSKRANVPTLSRVASSPLRLGVFLCSHQGLSKGCTNTLLDNAVAELQEKYVRWPRTCYTDMHARVTCLELDS